MATTILENVENLILNTGNMLSINDITKKPGQNPTEELIEAINITLKDFQNDNALPLERSAVITRPNDDLLTKIKEHDLNELKIGVKIFLNCDSRQVLTAALEEAFKILSVQSIDDVILAFKHSPADTQKVDLDEIINVWKILENYKSVGKIKQLGLADVEENTFKALYDCASVKPSIIQINLATCCVVPPTLQAFCKDKDVKLLTHSDPTDILPKPSIEAILGKPFSLQWALRFLIHVKCRGVLATKGYLLSLEK